MLEEQDCPDDLNDLQKEGGKKMRKHAGNSNLFFEIGEGDFGGFKYSAATVGKHEGCQGL